MDNREKLVGYSEKISDPAFNKFIRDTKLWSLLFAGILALIVIVSFYIYGERSYEMDNPEALYIGFVIGGMFILIALMQIISRARSKTWDGVVVGKDIKPHRRKVYQSNGSDSSTYYWKDYRVYNVYIQKPNGKTHTIRSEDDDTLYNYYRIGEHVRHHKGLNTIEKYDKSHDDIIFCNACAYLNDIKSDKCVKCKAPLLK